jgi:hypothetical protein
MNESSPHPVLDLTLFFCVFLTLLPLTLFAMALPIERALPEELLAYIIFSTSLDTLPNLCRTSKTLNRLTMSYLYSAITIGDEESVDSLALPPFACTVFTAPDVARLVNSVVINEWYECRDKEQDHAVSEESDWPDKFGNQVMMQVVKSVCANHTISEAAADELYSKVESARDEASRKWISALETRISTLALGQRSNWSLLVSRRWTTLDQTQQNFLLPKNRTQPLQVRSQRLLTSC